MFFPGRCVVCDRPTDRQGILLCSSCVPKIGYVKAPFCMKCGKKIEGEDTEYCKDCFNKSHRYIRAMSVYDYGSMADSIFRYKYAGRAEYAKFYGYDMFRQRGRWLMSLGAQALVPVPIHKSRLKKRGYNQAQLLAEALSAYTGIPVCDSLIARCKKTGPQKNLTDRQRQNNLKKAFKILQNDVKLSTIVIIDDIYTTGSTVDAMCEVLGTAGIRNIYCLTLAVGRGI